MVTAYARVRDRVQDIVGDICTFIDAEARTHVPCMRCAYVHAVLSAVRKHARLPLFTAAANKNRRSHINIRTHANTQVLAHIHKETSIYAHA